LQAQLAARRTLFRKGKEPPSEEEEFELVEEVTEELVDVREVCTSVFSLLVSFLFLFVFDCFCTRVL
jgi:hypothetical protein